MELKLKMPERRTARASVQDEPLPAMLEPREWKVFLIFAASIIICLALAVIVPFVSDYTWYQSFNLMLLPLMGMGVYGYVIHSRWILLVIASAATVTAIVLLPWGTVETILVTFGFEGAAVAADMIQRLVFYRILRTIEFVNGRNRNSPLELLALYLFDIPKGLDTRRIDMEDGIRRKGIPVREIANRILLALFFCMFIWMFMFADKNYSEFTSGSVDAVFIAMGYIAVAVLSMSAFETLDVRIETDHGGFRIYDGLIGTMSRIIIPLILATVLLAIVLWKDPFVLVSIAMSIVVMLAMVVIASELYYGYLENSTVKAIQRARREFMPSGICSSLGGDVPSLADAPPGTPRRDPASCFEPVQARKN